MMNHWIESGRRKFFLTAAGGIAGLAVGSSPARVLAQPAGGPLSASAHRRRARGRRTRRALCQGRAPRDVFVPPSRYIEGARR